VGELNDISGYNMIIPAYFIKELGNHAHTFACLNDPERFRPFYMGDSLTYNPCDDAKGNTWFEYFYLSCKNNSPQSPDDIIGVLRFPITRPVRKITDIHIALYNEKYAKTFFKDLKQVLKLIYDNNHPILMFSTVGPSQAYNLYESMTKKGYLTDNTVPAEMNEIAEVKYKQYRYSMDRDQLKKFLKL